MCSSPVRLGGGMITVKGRSPPWGLKKPPSSHAR